MSNDRWTPRYEHDDADAAPEAAAPPAAPEQPARAASDIPASEASASSSEAPDWGGGSGASPTAKDWQEGRVDTTSWQQGMTAKELAASTPDEEPADPQAEELEPVDDEAALVPAVPAGPAPLAPSSGLLYGLGMLAMVLFLAPTFIGLIEVAMAGNPWWSTALGLLHPVGILLAAHVVLRILLSIRDGRR